MALLKLEIDGITVLTNAWTAVSKSGGRKTDIAYCWGADGLSFFSSATGVARATLRLPFNDFVNYVSVCQAKGKVIDLTNEQALAPFIR